MTMSNPFGGTATKAPGGFTADAVKSSDPYAASVPSTASDTRMSDPGILGELMLVEPVEYIDSMLTSASKEPTDVFRVNLLPLTGDMAGQLHEDVLIFQTALKRELKKTYSGPNRWLLARCEMGSAKPGKNAPYLFNPPTAEDMALYEKFKASRA